MALTTARLQDLTTYVATALSGFENVTEGATALPTDNVTSGNDTGGQPPVYDYPDYVLPNQLTNWLIADDIKEVIPPILLVVGTVFNVLSFIVFSGSNLRGSTTGLLFRILAVADTLALNIGIWPSWVRSFSDLSLVQTSNTSCKIYGYITYIATDLPGWILVIITVERFMGIMVPHKAKLIFTKKKAMIQVCVVAAMLLLVNIPIPMTAVLNVYSGPDGTVLARECGVQVEDGSAMSDFLQHVWPWWDLVFLALGPFCVMIVCNTAIIGRLYIASRRRRAMSSGDTSSGPQLTSLTIILLTVSFSFLVLTLPILTFILSQLTYASDGADPYETARLYLWYTCGAITQYTNNTINFLLYCVSGRRFRSELIAILRCGKKKSVTQTATSRITQDATSSKVVSSTDNKI